ncbi:MAG: cupin-like domain-containing protein [Planctomycetes bacterium]|nr:cupin-like domain-containing protein [Planctomycetota bacterium]
MIMRSPELVELPDARPRQLEEEVTKFQHRLADSGLFSDENLIRIMDDHPRDYCNVSRMGIDNSTYEWGEGDTTGLTGADLLEAVRKGRLWINVRRLMWYQPELRSLVERLYAELEQKCPQFHTSKHSANLLISSPNALVYYHLDVPQNILWHIRGRKRVWVYPLDERTISRDLLVRTVAGERIEDLPYNAGMDEFAQVFDLQPGDVVTWPQNFPHRVENENELNVSLSTEHYTPRQLRHVRVCRANCLLRKTVGYRSRSLKTDGFGYAVKSSLLLGTRVIQRLWGRGDVSYDYPMTFRVNPNAPDGVEPLENAETPELPLT